MNAVQHLHQQLLRQSIITDMFSSGWNRDILVEVPLAEVKMPAALFVRDPLTKKIVSYHGPKPGGDEPLPDIEVLMRNPWPASIRTDLPPARDIGFKPAMSFIVQGYPQRGKFDVKRAFSHGVPPGRSFGLLASGQSVRSKSGDIVTPEMVLGPPKPGKGIAIVDLPSRGYVYNLTQRPEWTSEHIRKGIAAVCWILGPGVASDPELKNFIESMPDVEHIISSEEFCPNYLAFCSSAASSIRLSRISNHHFPVPVHNNVAPTQIASANDGGLQELPAATAACRGLVIQIEPEFCLQRDEVVPPLNTAEVVQSLPLEVQRHALLAHEQVAEDNGSLHDFNSRESTELSTFNPEIITLGTGSASPSKYRNVSATLLRTGRYGNLLFDCGENTLGQLRRVFDSAALGEVLRDLRLIWISHLHADHHLGTVSVLMAQKRAFMELEYASKDDNNWEPAGSRQPTVVASDSKMLRFLDEYQSVEPLPHIRRLVCQASHRPILNGEMANFLQKKLGIKSLQTVGVDHCVGAQAISVTFENDFKFSYSGDCRPSVPFATMGKGSDVLVHEATFDDDMEEDALAKKHCTTKEALGIAVKMEAKNVILTHFSQRYQKLPTMGNVKAPLSSEVPASSNLESLPGFLGELGEYDASIEEEEGNFAPDSELPDEKKLLLDLQDLDTAVSSSSRLGMNICVAFDYMRVRVSDIKHMHKFTPALAALFMAEQKKMIEEAKTIQAKSKRWPNQERGSKKSKRKTDG